MIASFRSEAKPKGFNEDFADAFVVNNGFYALVFDAQATYPSYSIGRMLSNTIQMWVEKHSFSNPNQFYYVMNDALEVANEKLKLLNAVSHRTMASSFVLVANIPDLPQLYLAYAGNIAVYQIASGSIRKITEEHSESHLLLKSGQITEEEYYVHDKRSWLTKYLGSDTLSYESALIPYQTNDRFALLTDGVHRVVGEEELLAISLETDTVEMARDVLVDLALERQGFDDATASMVWAN